MSDAPTSDPLVPTDADLIHRWLCSMRLAKPEARYTRREAVMRLFAVGSTSADGICKRHGFDPHEKVRKP